MKEIGEEELQLYLEPAFQAILFGEDYDAPTIDEILETAIITALATPVLDAGLAEGLISLGNTLKAGSKAQALATELKGKANVTNGALGELYIAIEQELQNGNITAQEAVANAVQTIGNAQETDATPKNPSAPHLDTAVQTAYTEHTGQSPSMLAELTEAFQNGAKRAGYVPENPSQPTSSSVGPLREAPATESAANAATGVGVPDVPQQSPEFTATVTEPTVAELTEAFMAGVEGRQYVPKTPTEDSSDVFDFIPQLKSEKYK